MTVEDLCVLLALDGPAITPQDLMACLNRVPGDILAPVSTGPSGRPVTVFQLGHGSVSHEVLKRMSPEDFTQGEDPDDEQWWAQLGERVLAPYRDLILRWADERVAQHGWSEGTPSYLLGDGYLAVVRRRRHEAGVLAVLTDRDRNDEVAIRRGSAYTIIRAIDETTDAFLRHQGADLADSDLEAVLLVAEERARLLRRRVATELIRLEVEHFGTSADVVLEQLLSTGMSGARLGTAEEILDGAPHGDESTGYVDCVWHVLDSVQGRGSVLSDEVCRLRAHALTRVGQLREAARAAEQVDDPSERIRTLLRVADALAEAGDAREAVRVARVAEDAAEQVVFPWDHARALVDIAGALNEMGDTRQAVRVAGVAEQAAEQLLGDPWERSEAQGYVAGVLAEAGDAREAVRVAGAAEQTAEQLDSPWERSMALFGVARTWIRVGERQEALRVAQVAEHLAEQNEDTLRRAWSLVDVARVLAAAGDREGAVRVVGAAVRVAEQVEALDQRARTLVHAAGVLAGVGAAQEAVCVVGAVEQIAEQLEDQRGHRQVLLDAVEFLAAAGQTREAARVAGVVEHLAGQVESAERRVWPLVELARVLADAGQAREAARVAGLAEQNTGCMDNPRGRMNALVATARVLACTGDVESAERVAAQAAQVTLPEPRGVALEGVARALAGAGDAEAAERVAALAEQVEPPQEQVSVGATDPLAEVEDVAGARRVIDAELRRARALTDPDDGARTCGRLALSCCEMGGGSAPDGQLPPQWRALAAQCLAHAWLLGASVWDHFEVLMRVAPSLGRRLVDERLLAGRSVDDEARGEA